MAIPQKVEIVEVGPRDGLQNEAATVSVDDRARLVELLAQAGLRRIEAGSFVSEKSVPQMAATADVFGRLQLAPKVRLSALVPNLRGLNAALAAEVKEIAVFAAASETFSKRNINCSIAESLERYAAVAAEAKHRRVLLRGYVSCALGCPYEGAVAPERVAAVARDLAALGCDEISLGDTIGVGTPLQARGLVERVAREIGLARVAVHFHDTYGQALANIFACLEAGVAVIDSSVAGLGGCPYAPGASGNVATEDVVYMLDGLGVETGVDLDVLLRASAFITGRLGKPPASSVAKAAAGKSGACRSAASL
ncbi:MAG TPA: hydroxymethylglutaryl-CoA lyase [Methylocystis sp.]|nr:hydroxymethylglutaryl-CoA lyase [Methylocystis sp.]